MINLQEIFNGIIIVINYQQLSKSPLQLPRSTALHSWSTTAFVAPENSQKDLGLFDFILNAPTAVDTEVFAS